MRPFRERRVRFDRRERLEPETFSKPNFNVDAKIWYNLPPDTSIPPSRDPDAQTQCQLYSTPLLLAVGAVLNAFSLAVLRCPTGAPIHGLVAPGNSSDVVEVPANSGRFYAVLAGEAVALGFPNQYYQVLLNRLHPTVGPPNP